MGDESGSKNHNHDYVSEHFAIHRHLLMLNKRKLFFSISVNFEVGVLKIATVFNSFSLLNF